MESPSSYFVFSQSLRCLFLAATASLADITPTAADTRESSRDKMVRITTMAATQNGNHSRRLLRSFHHCRRLRGAELSNSRSILSRLDLHMQNSCTNLDGSIWHPALLSISSPEQSLNHSRHSGSGGISSPNVASASLAYSCWAFGPLPYSELDLLCYLAVI